MDAKGLPVGSASTFATARPRRTVKCDACGGEGAHGNQRRCDVCGGSGRRDQHLFELRLEGGREEAPDPLDAAIDARDASGSYHELDLALAGIVHHVNKPVRFRWLTDNAVLALRLLDEVFLPPVSRQEAELEPEERALVDLALAYVVGRMPDPIRVPADVRANVRVLAGRRTLARGRGAPRTALSQRDGEIRSLARRGRPVQWIAAEYGLGVSTVYEIVNGDAA